ncbi:MAG TPA: hypothetical protein VF131_09140 [Blastocatellia bacterium]|nr:hypothetical protein [Blastocatellia bacterium]
MYCSSCGAESGEGLQYCKRCGVNLSPAEPANTTGKPRGLVWIVTFGIAMIMGLPMGGIAVVYERIPDLLAQGFPLWFLTVLAIISLLMMSVATVLLSRLLAPLFKAYLQSGDVTQSRKQKPGVHTAAQLNAPRDSVSNASEETTRSFEPIAAERDTGS